MVEEHNKKFEQGLEDYELGLNEFSDLYYSEFLMRKTGFRGDLVDKNLKNKNK
jgi:hypothetical protein